MGEVLVDGKAKVEDTTLIHALVGFDGQGEVKDVVGVWERHFHRAAEGKFLKVWRDNKLEAHTTTIQQVSSASYTVHYGKVTHLVARVIAPR